MIRHPLRLAVALLAAAGSPCLVTELVPTAHADEHSEYEEAHATLVANARLAAYASDALAEIARETPPEELSHEDQEDYDAQSAWIADSATKLADLAVYMEDLLETEALLEEMNDANLEMLMLQAAVSDQANHYQGMSNIIKSRDDAVSSVIRNIKD